MKKNINLCNGNQNSWITADELTDEQVKIIIEVLNVTSDDEEWKYAAEGAETDREYIRRYADAAGELIIG